MGKAARNKREKRTSGKMVFPGFPYAREFTKAELDVLFARWERLKETLRDAIGPQGWGLGMSEDFLQQIALHQALAGVDVDVTYPPDVAFIRPVRNPEGLHVDSIKWVLTKHDKPGDVPLTAPLFVPGSLWNQPAVVSLSCVPVYTTQFGG